MFGKEPTVIIGALAEVVRAIIPLLLIFGYLNWNDQQIGQVMLFIGVFVGFLNVLFTRSQVTPTETANAQIVTAIASPSGTTVKEVIDATEAKQ